MKRVGHFFFTGMAFALAYGYLQANQNYCTGKALDTALITCGFNGGSLTYCSPANDIDCDTTPTDGICFTCSPGGDYYVSNEDLID